MTGRNFPSREPARRILSGWLNLEPKQKKEVTRCDDFKPHNMEMSY